MTFGTFNADQFKRQLMNYTEAELIKLGRSCSSAASRWLDPMTQQLNASKYELRRKGWHVLIHIVLPIRSFWLSSPLRMKSLV